jgi:hypothetical protein
MTEPRSGHPDQPLSAAVSGDLTAIERAELDAHLAGCPSCRESLAGQTEARRLLAEAPRPEAPADLHARIGTAVESGSGGGSRVVRVGAAAATVAAAILVFAVFRQTVDLPGASQEPSASAGPSQSAAPSPSPTEPAVDAFLAPGDMGYLVLSGGGFSDYRLAFVNARTNAELQADEAPSGGVVASALSPDGRWLAYITVLGETGANEVWVMSLIDGSTHQIGCTAPAVYSDRLTWSPDSLLLAYTLVALDGSSELSAVGCELTELGAAGSSDAWLFNTSALSSSPLTTSGDVYVASFTPWLSVEGGSSLWISHMSQSPSSASIAANGMSAGSTEGHADGVFLPTIDETALFYRPVFVQEGADWSLQGGGIPLLGSTWTDLTSLFSGTETIDPGTAGSSLAPWQVAWGADNDSYIVWTANWNVVFVGHASTPGAENAQQVTVDMPIEGAWIVGAALSPDANMVVVTVGLPSAGIGDPPTSLHYQVDLTSGTVTPPCCGGETPWVGPVVFGGEPFIFLH